MKSSDETFGLFACDIHWYWGKTPGVNSISRDLKDNAAQYYTVVHGGITLHPAGTPAARGARRPIKQMVMTNFTYYQGRAATIG